MKNKPHTAKICLNPDKTGNEAAYEKKSTIAAAFDIGTTEVSAELWDLSSCRLINRIHKKNPQTLYGSDIISRIRFANLSNKNEEILHNEIISCCNSMINQLCGDDVEKSSIDNAVVVGNTAMLHFFTGTSAKELGYAQFTPEFCRTISVSPKKLGIGINENGCIKLLPAIGGYAGSDLTAAVLFSKITLNSGLNLIIDVGTNTEIAAAMDGRLLVCTAPAGPAFEGAQLINGMKAASGAISSFKIDDSGNICLETIENAEPCGICGSGIIDIVAALLCRGIIYKNGRILQRYEAILNDVKYSVAERIYIGRSNPFFLLYKNKINKIIITQQDIRQIQLAKAATAAAVRTLLHILAAKESDISSLCLTGTFGSRLNIENAKLIGLLPKIDTHKIRLIDNAALSGASSVLLSPDSAKYADTVAEYAEHIQLSTLSYFKKQFTASIDF